MKQNRKFNFTNRAITALKAPPADSKSRATEYSDSTVTGLKLSVGKNGSKSFAYRYVFNGIKRYACIGDFPGIDVAEARQTATAMGAQVDRGVDPLEGQDRIKAMPTFEEFVNSDYLPFARQTKRSYRDDESKFRVHLIPKFGSRRLSDIDTRAIQQHHAAIRESLSAATANRHLALLSAVFRKAVEWGKLDRNPVATTKLFKENSIQERYLQSDEIARIFEAMKTEPNQTAVAALKLLLLTGVRRSEALTAEWANVDLESGTWRLPMTKSGRGRNVPLNDDAKALLAAQPSRGTSRWVFPGRDGDKPLNNPRKAFTRILTVAGVEHIRIHGLRHTFASTAVGNGVSLYDVQGLLGHSSPQMTQRYAHLGNTELRRASQVASSAISAAANGTRDSAA